MKINIVIILMFTGLILTMFFYLNEKVDSFNILKSKEKIVMIQYKEISKAYDLSRNINQSISYVTYLYPNKLKIETQGKIKTVEIYNRKRYIYYDINSGSVKSKAFYNKITAPVIVKSRELDKIMKEGNYKALGFEEKDDKKLEIIGVTSGDEEHQLLHKYWIERILNTNLIYKEEYFIDNIVESETTYIYLKINEQLEDGFFEFKN